MKKYFPILLICAAGELLSFFLGSDRYVQRIILLIVLWACASSSFNIISGYAGQVVFGYMMFVGTGAYTTVILFKFLHVTPWLGMWAGAIVSALTALIIGIPTLRLQGAFFAIATIAFPLITFPILNHLGLEEVSIPFTGHGVGDLQFRDMRGYVLVAIVLLAVVLSIVRAIESSGFGYKLKALKQNEAAAEAMGIDTYRSKLLAFIISAALAALMGTLYSFGLLYVMTTNAIFGIFIMVRIMSITIVGGMSTVWGPLVAAAILVPAGELLNSQFGDRYPGVQDIIYGIALIAAIIYMPEGIWGKIRRGLPSSAPKLAATPSVLPPVPRPIKTEMDFILRTDGVSKNFGGVTALCDVTISIPRGKVTGIIGPNGSGKTTLFNVINGFTRPEKGKVIFNGVNTTHLSPHTCCMHGIGRTFQIPQVFSNMTIRENIMIGALNRSGNMNEAHAKASTIAQEMGLGSRASSPAVGLTLWDIKMLEFSRALATQPILLLIDEPMAGLNPEEANRLGEMIQVISASGITVLIIEHVVSSLVKIADWMVGLDNGQKVCEGLPEEVMANPQIIEAYLGAKWRDRHAVSG